MAGKGRRGEREEGGGRRGQDACHGRFPVLVGNLHEDKRRGGGFNPGHCEFPGLVAAAHRLKFKLRYGRSAAMLDSWSVAWNQ